MHPACLEYRQNLGLLEGPGYPAYPMLLEFLVLLAYLEYPVCLEFLGHLEYLAFLERLVYPGFLEYPECPEVQ